MGTRWSDLRDMFGDRDVWWQRGVSRLAKDGDGRRGRFSPPSLRQRWTQYPPRRHHLLLLRSWRMRQSIYSRIPSSSIPRSPTTDLGDMIYTSPASASPRLAARTSHASEGFISHRGKTQVSSDQLTQSWQTGREDTRCLLVPAVLSFWMSHNVRHTGTPSRQSCGERDEVL